MDDDLTVALVEMGIEARDRVPGRRRLLTRAWMWSCGVPDAPGCCRPILCCRLSLLH
jgi:hypothetical protein